MNQSRNRGFTLIELLVVIGIISILATVLLLQLGTARAKSRDAKRIADINQVRSAVELYFDDNGSYPATNALSALLVPKYLLKLPTDPLTTTCSTTTYDGAAGAVVDCYGYAYDPAANPTKYQVWADLEQSNRNALASDADIDTSAWAGGAKKNGATETCTTGTPSDCIFDLGQN